MAGYWRTVLSAAWDNTYKPLGWDRKKIALALLAVGTILVAGFRLGWPAMITTAVGYLWLGAPVLFAALVLFVWGIIEAQAKLYADLMQTSAAKITDLELALARSEEPPPNYEAWRHVEELTLIKAAFLWCDLEPRISRTPKVTAWFSALAAAIKKGELDFVPQYRDYPHDRSRQREHQRSRPYDDTIVTRSALKEFAREHGYDPVFLRESC